MYYEVMHACIYIHVCEVGMYTYMYEWRVDRYVYMHTECIHICVK